jgi:hypothetical protein
MAPVPKPTLAIQFRVQPEGSSQSTANRSSWLFQAKYTVFTNSLLGNLIRLYTYYTKLNWAYCLSIEGEIQGLIV